MRLAVAVLLVTAVAAYGPGSHVQPSTGGCGGGGAGCGGAAPGGGGGALPVGVIRGQPSKGANRRVADVSGGGYWWQSNNPFVGAGNRAPSSGGSVGGAGGGSFPASGGGGGAGGRPTKFPSGGSGSFPVSQQPFDNSIVGPMGICPPEFVCVHWQLCRNGQVILDGTGIIDKSKRRPAGQYDSLQGCGGDMICCGVTPGYTVPGVISTLTSQLPGSSETVQASLGSNTPLHSSTHLSPVGTLSVNAPASDLHPGSAVPQRDSGFSSVGSAKPSPDEPSAVHTALPASSLSASPAIHSLTSNIASSVPSAGHGPSDEYPSSAHSFPGDSGSVSHFDSSSDASQPSSLPFGQTVTSQSLSDSKTSSHASHSTLHSSSQNLPAGSFNAQTSSQPDQFSSSVPGNHDLTVQPLASNKPNSSHIGQSLSSGNEPHSDSKFESHPSIAGNVPNLHSTNPNLPAASTSVGVPSLPGLYEPPVNNESPLSVNIDSLQNEVSVSSSDSSSISSSHSITSSGVHSGTSDFVSGSHVTPFAGNHNVLFTDSATSSGPHDSTSTLGGQSTSVNNQVSLQNPSVPVNDGQTSLGGSFVDSSIPEEYLPPTTSLGQGSAFGNVTTGEKLPSTSQSKPHVSQTAVTSDQNIHHSSSNVESFSSNLDSTLIKEPVSSIGTQNTQAASTSILSSNISESDAHSVSQTYPQSDSSSTSDTDSGSAFGSNVPTSVVPTLEGGYLPPDRNTPSVDNQQSSAGKTVSNAKPNFLDQGHLIASLTSAFDQSSSTSSGASGTQGTLHPTSVGGGEQGGVSNHGQGGIPIVFNENVSPSGGGSFGGVAPNDVRAPSAGLPKPSHGGSFGSAAGSKKPFGSGVGSGSSGSSFNQPGPSSGGFPKPGTPGGAFNQPGCSGGSAGGCGQPGSFPQPAPGSSYPQPGATGGPLGQLGGTLPRPGSSAPGGSYVPPSSSGGNLNQPGNTGSGFNQPGASGSSSGSGFNQPGASASGSYQPGSSGSGFNQPGSSGGGSFQPGSSGSSSNQPGSSGGGSYQQGSSGSGFNQPGSSGSGSHQSGSSGSGFNQPGSSGSGFNQPGSSGSGSHKSGSSGSGFNQPGSSGSGFNQPGSSGSGSHQSGSSGSGFNQPGSSGSGFNQPGSSGTGAYQPGSSGSGLNQPGGSAGSSGFNQNNPGSQGSQGFNQHGGNQGAPGAPGYNQPGQSGGGSGFPSGGFNQPSGGSLSQAGSSFPQNNVANPMANMMANMMGMGGTPLLAGSCSAGTFCVPPFQCNPYNGFIIMDPAALQAVWPDAPKVPLLDCLIPAGVLNGGVCCQQTHPIVGPNGQVLD